VLSRFQSSSQLNQLNHSGYLEKMDESLAEVLLQAKDIWSLTQGAFDITIEPLLAGYRQAAERGQSLSRDQVEALLALVGQEELTLTAGEARLGRAGMAITLDGIAKGFIIDQGVKTLGGHGFDRVMVEVGGDLQATGGVDEAWRVGIQAPRKEFDGYLGIVELPQGAMATSGDYMNAFSEDFSAHHILDPRSGRSPAQVASVTTLAPSAMLSDALSTALMVLGPQAGLVLVEGLPQVEALLVGKDLKQYLSSGFVLL
jgi:thiamine biosynthesis lipoprotein